MLIELEELHKQGISHIREVGVWLVIYVAPSALVPNDRGTDSLNLDEVFDQLGKSFHSSYRLFSLQNLVLLTIDVNSASSSHHEPLPRSLGSRRSSLSQAIAPVLTRHLKPRDDVYGRYDHSYLKTSGPVTHTQSPGVTGTSVVAVKFNGGVVMAADNLGKMRAHCLVQTCTYFRRAQALTDLWPDSPTLSESESLTTPPSLGSAATSRICSTSIVCWTRSTFERTTHLTETR